MFFCCLNFTSEEFYPFVSLEQAQTLYAHIIASILQASRFIRMKDASSTTDLLLIASWPWDVHKAMAWMHALTHNTNANLYTHKQKDNTGIYKNVQGKANFVFFPKNICDAQRWKIKYTLVHTCLFQPILVLTKSVIFFSVSFQPMKSLKSLTKILLNSASKLSFKYLAFHLISFCMTHY